VEQPDTSGSRLIRRPRSTGFVRKKLGFTFLGETRHGEHWVIADMRIKNLDTSVCRSTDIRVLEGSDHVYTVYSIGTCGATSRTRCERDKLSDISIRR